MKTRFFLVFITLVMVSFPLIAQDKPDALQTYRIGRDMEAQGRLNDASAKYDEAVRICQNEIAQNATNMDSYTVLTWALLRQKKYPDTVTWGLKGLNVNPNDYRIIETLGEAYFYLNNYPESLKAMQKYVDSVPQGERVSVAYFFMGEIYRIQQQFRHADIAYTMAVNLESDISLWWYRLGLVRENAGDYASAVQAYTQALKLNPAYKEASDGLDRAKKQVG